MRSRRRTGPIHPFPALPALLTVPLCPSGPSTRSLPCPPYSAPLSLRPIHPFPALPSLQCPSVPQAHPPVPRPALLTVSPCPSGPSIRSLPCLFTGPLPLSLTPICARCHFSQSSPVPAVECPVCDQAHRGALLHPLPPLLLSAVMSLWPNAGAPLSPQAAVYSLLLI